MQDITLKLGNSLELIKEIPDASIDAIITDPPYAYIKRDYGYWLEEEWFELMRPMTMEFKRVLKPSGSAMILLQPNSEKLGRMRSWLWKYLIWCNDNWNIIQNVYFWNTTTMPDFNATKGGMFRNSLKYCVWLGNPNCYKNQIEILLNPSERIIKKQQRQAYQRLKKRIYTKPSGHRENTETSVALKKGGVTPFNVIPISLGDSVNSSGAYRHGAGTPEKLVDYWMRYITKVGDVVLDPFMGAGTTAVVAKKLRRRCIGFEIQQNFHEMSIKRLNDNGLFVSNNDDHSNSVSFLSSQTEIDFGNQ